MELTLKRYTTALGRVVHEHRKDGLLIQIYATQYNDVEMLYSSLNGEDCFEVDSYEEALTRAKQICKDHYAELESINDLLMSRRGEKDTSTC